jgi:hypothetical protein
MKTRRWSEWHRAVLRSEAVRGEEAGEQDHDVKAAQDDE